MAMALSVGHAWAERSLGQAKSVFQGTATDPYREHSLAVSFCLSVRAQPAPLCGYERTCDSLVIHCCQTGRTSTHNYTEWHGRIHDGTDQDRRGRR